MSQKKRFAAEVVKKTLRKNQPGFYDEIRKIIDPIGGVDLPEIAREQMREPPDFSGPEFGQYDDEVKNAPEKPR